MCRACPTLLMITAAQADIAVAAMRKGVFGYALLPLVPGEVEVMVQRALADGSAPAENLAPVTLAEMEERHIQEVLRHCNNNQAKAARVLGIGRNTLWRKLKRGAPEDGD
jgi:DNA-binding NtrC family response regulator